MLNLFTNREKRTIERALLCCALVGSVLLGRIVPNNPARIAGLALVGLASLGLFASKSIILLYIVVWGTMLGSGVERGYLIPLLKPNEVLLLWIMAIFLVKVVGSSLHHHEEIEIGVVDTAFVLLFLTRCIIPLIVSLARGEMLTTESAKVLFSLPQYYLLFRLVISVVSSEEDVIRVIRVMLIASAVVALVGSLQLVNVFGVRDFLTRYHIGSHYELSEQAYFLSYARTTSLLGSWNTLGSYLALNITIAALCLMSRNKILSRKLLVPVIVLDTAGMIISGSFTAFIMLMVGLFMIQLLTKGGRIGPILAILVGMSISVILFRPLIENRLASRFTSGIAPTNLTSRFELWRYWLWPQFRAQPAAIVLGFGHLEQVVRTHNYYLFLLYHFGFLPLLAYMRFMLVSLRKAHDLFRKHSGFNRTIGLATLLILVQVNIAGLAGPYFEYSGVAETVWLMLGLAVVMARLWKVTN